MDLTGQWADSLLALERLFYTKLIVWGALCIVGGSAVITVLLVRRMHSPLLRRFAEVTLASGVFAVLAGLARRSGAALRDLEGAITLDRWLWFGIGLDAGLMLLGATLVACGFLWRAQAKAPERLGLAGAGVAVVVQGLALALLSLQLTAGLVR